MTEAVIHLFIYLFCILTYLICSSQVVCDTPVVALPPVVAVTGATLAAELRLRFNYEVTHHHFLTASQDGWTFPNCWLFISSQVNWLILGTELSHRLNFDYEVFPASAVERIWHT